MKPFLNWLLHYLPSLLWAGVIFVLLGIPGRFFSKYAGNTSFEGADKLAHMGIFAVFIFFFMLGSQKHYKAPVRSQYTLIAFFIALLLGIVSEAYQKYFTSTRSGDLKDVIADVAGCFLGVFMFYLYNLIFFRK